MQISILLMEQIFELFLLILMGFIIVKAGIVKEEDSKELCIRDSSTAHPNFHKAFRHARHG